MTTLNFQLERVETPIGQMLVVTDAQQRLRAIDWHDYEDRMYLLMHRQYKGLSLTFKESPQESANACALHAYFEGDIAIIKTLQTALGGTDFQRQVWAALCEIPANQPFSYRDLAIKIERPMAIRAVGTAIGANPIGIVIPCHRVSGSNGTLTGYAAGLQRKQWLLQHEKTFALV